MKVEVLYVTDCPPSHPLAVRLLKDVLAAEGIKAEFTEVLVVDAQMASELKFRGCLWRIVNSPSRMACNIVTSLPMLLI
jgi:hypothetical protein